MTWLSIRRSAGSDGNVTGSVAAAAAIAGVIGIVYATAIELGVRLITKDERIRSQRSPRPIALW
jgi:hypothetical protein